MTVLLHWVWQGLIVAALVSLALRLVPRLDGATRHALWWVALAVVLGLPLAWPDAVRTPAADLATAAASASAIVLPAEPDWFLSVGVGAWLGWVALGFARLRAGLRELTRLRERSWPLPARVGAGLTRWPSLPTDRRRAELRVSGAIQGACAIGLGQPVILVSRQLVNALDANALDLIVLHEQAHLDRRDDWGRLAQSIITCLAGVHPAVAFITRQIDLEREVACDERVVATTGASRAYAQSLTDAAALAARGRVARVPAVVPGVIRTRRTLTARVRRVLTAVSPATSRMRRAACLGSAAVVVLIVSLAGRVHPLVVFANLVLETPPVHSVSLSSWRGEPLRVPVPEHVETPRAAANVALLRPPRTGTPGFTPVAAVAPVARVEHAAHDEEVVIVTASEGMAPLEASPLRLGIAPFAVGADIGRGTGGAGTVLGAAFSGGGQEVGRAATQAGRSMAGFFGRAGRAVGVF